MRGSANLAMKRRSQGVPQSKRDSDEPQCHRTTRHHYGGVCIRHERLPRSLLRREGCSWGQSRLDTESAEGCKGSSTIGVEKRGVRSWAHAVVGVDLDYSEISGGGKSMLFVVATGTAIKLDDN